MNGKPDFRHPHRGRALLVAGLVLLAAALPLFTGCEGDSDATAILSPETEGLATLGMAPPTLSELESAVGLNASQVRLIEPALARWTEAAAEPRPKRDGRRSRMHGEGSPVHAFLEDAGQSLDTGAFVSVVEFLSERRETFRAEHRAEKGTRGRGLHGLHARMAQKFHGGGHRTGHEDGHGGFFADADLSDEQKRSLHETLRDTHKSLGDMHKALAQGDLSAEQARDRLQGSVDEARTSLKGILTEEQFDLVWAKMTERSMKMAGRGLKHLDQAAGERHVTFLTRVLVLDDSQAAAVKTAFSGARPQVESLLSSIENGELTFPNAVYEGLLIHDGVKEAVTGILNDEQNARMEALKKLTGGPRGPF